MIDETPMLKSFHDTYCRCSGLHLEFTMDYLCMWRVFASRFTLDDLELVIRHIKRKIPDRNRQMYAMRIRWFIGYLNDFGELLAEARALNRAPKRYENRESVMAASGRPPPEPPAPVHTAAEILASNAAFQKLLAMKQSL